MPLTRAQKRFPWVPDASARCGSRPLAWAFRYDSKSMFTLGREYKKKSAARDVRNAAQVPLFLPGDGEHEISAAANGG